MYRQLDGLAMGSPLRTTLANIFVESQEVRLLKKAKTCVLLHMQMTALLCSRQKRRVLSSTVTLISCILRYSLQMRVEKTISYYIWMSCKCNGTAFSLQQTLFWCIWEKSKFVGRKSKKRRLLVTAFFQTNFNKIQFLTAVCVLFTPIFWRAKVVLYFILKKSSICALLLVSRCVFPRCMYSWNPATILWEVVWPCYEFKNKAYTSSGRVEVLRVGDNKQNTMRGSEL